MDTEKIAVFARVRPLSGRNSHLEVDSDRSMVIISGRPFEFDGAFGPESTQAEVFQKSAEHIVDGVLDGLNGTIFAYGQTGSGKTYTMSGPDVYSESNKGIIPRCLEKLCREHDRCADKNDTKLVMRASFVELYREEIYDLLDPAYKPRVRQTDGRDVELANASSFYVSTVDEVQELIERGCNNRHVAETSMNRESSRSHSVFTILVEVSSTSETGAVSIRTARLNLIDLAGSERQSHSKAAGERLKEAAQINKSLSTLARVIRALGDKSAHIPYRDSVLTYLLSQSLGGNSRTAFVLTMHQDDRFLENTLSTANFARSLQRVQNVVTVNQNLIIGSNEIYIAEMQRMRAEYEQRIAELSANQRRMPRMSMIERETDRSTKLEQQLNEERNQHSKQLADQVKAFNDFRRMMQMNEEQQAQALKASADENAELKKRLQKYKAQQGNTVSMQRYEAKKALIESLTAQVNQLTSEKEHLKTQLEEKTAELADAADRLKEQTRFKPWVDQDNSLNFSDDMPNGRPAVLYTCNEKLPSRSEMKRRARRRTTIFEVRDGLNERLNRLDLTLLSSGDEAEPGAKDKRRRAGGRRASLLKPVMVNSEANAEVEQAPEKENDENQQPSVKPKSAPKQEPEQVEEENQHDEEEEEEEEKASDSVEPAFRPDTLVVDERGRTLAEVVAENESMHELVKRCHEQMDRFEQERVDFSKRIAVLHSELVKITEQRDNYMSQAMEGVGHGNQRQKISYVNKLRDELIEAKNEIARLSAQRSSR